MTTQLGRHRSAVRAKTPITVLSAAVSTNASTVSRRSAVIAASSGLVVTMGLPAASAADNSAQPDLKDSTSTTQELKAVPAAAPISAADDAPVTFALSAVTAVDTSEADRVAAEAADRQAAAERATREAASSGASRSSDRDSISAETASAPASASASAAVDIAGRYYGVPYRMGGTSPSGFDCSGFVQYVYGQLGVSLPRTASSQASAGTRVSASQARPGDIVSFLGSGGVYHNGIYTGNGQMIDAPRSGKSVAERDIWSSNVMFTRVG